VRCAAATDMLRWSILIKRITSTSVGNVIRKENIMYTILHRIRQITILLTITIVTHSCTEFALITAGGSVAVSHNAYVKAYNGVDVLTIMATEKDIKKHVYDSIKTKTNPK